ncbi:hypothetical protein ANTRET_LOCUS5001 [Anthophora retusa]
MRERFSKRREAENKRTGPHPRRTFRGGPFLGSPPSALLGVPRFTSSKKLFEAPLGHSTRTTLLVRVSELDSFSKEAGERKRPPPWTRSRRRCKR